MKTALLTYFAPFFAAAMIALVSLFPTPAAVVKAIDDRHQLAEIVAAQNEAGAIRLANGTAPGHTLIAETPCFKARPDLSQRELYACGEFVLDLWRALQDDRIASIFDTGDQMVRSPVTDGEFLRLSATRLCRELWLRSNGNRAALDAPVCLETAGRIDSQRI